MDTLEQHKIFHKTFGQPVEETPIDITPERAKLRLKLAFEELSELASAFGLEGTFEDICDQYIIKSNHIDTNIIDKVEVLDALVDIEVINNGTVLETGFTTIFYDAYQQTHKNNMSKAHISLSETDKTIKKYQELGFKNLSVKQVDYLYVVYREDGKILKPYDYQTNDLSNFIL